MNLYGRGTIDIVADGLQGGRDFYVVRDPAGSVVGAIPYSWEEGQDPYAGALALLGLRRPYQAARALAYVRDDWDAGDPWGSGMMAAGAVCDVLTAAGCGHRITRGLGYHPGIGQIMITVDILADADPDIADGTTIYLAAALRAGELTVDDLATAVRVLDRYLDVVKANGKDY